jgi:hypothetical protein
VVFKGSVEQRDLVFSTSSQGAFSAVGDNCLIGDS